MYLISSKIILQCNRSQALTGIFLLCKSHNVDALNIILLRKGKENGNVRSQLSGREN